MSVAPSTVHSLRRRSYQPNHSRWGFLLIGPMVSGFAVFFIIALAASLVLSFTSWNLLKDPAWNGLANYRRIVTDPDFWIATRNTFAIAIPNVILRISIALGLAIAMNAKIAFRTFYRIVFFLPVLTMPVSTSTVFKWVFDPKFGPVNGILARFGIDGPAWLMQPTTATIAVVIVLLWSGVGYDMIIFMAGLQAIPKDYYEASALDGASPWRQFRDITLPLLTPTTFFLSVVAVIASLQVFDLVYVMTRLGQTNQLPTLVYYIYEEGFNFGRMGYAISIAWVLLAMILAFTGLQFWLQKKWVFYQ